MAKKGHPSARKTKKPASSGTGGHGRRALEGRGPTPKAEDRPWHPAGKKKQAKERLQAAKDRYRARVAKESTSSAGESVAIDLVIGRNSVVEALRSATPAEMLFVASGGQTDERVKEAVLLAKSRDIPVREVTRAALEQMPGAEGANQGIALQVPEYEYSNPLEMADTAEGILSTPVFVALDGVTDPRNLGAIVRSAAAFGASGVILPKRRSASITGAVWKTSAGALATTPVAVASNLTQTLRALRGRGYRVVGLDGAVGTDIEKIELFGAPLVLVVGGEQRGLSRLVSENCDHLARIPISERTESLNASVAVSVVLYEVSKQRRMRSN